MENVLKSNKKHSFLTPVLMRSFLQVLAVSQAILPVGWPRHYEIQHGQSFDYIVVGGGTAGAVVAARLSEVPDARVLVIEVGGNPPITSIIPSIFPLTWNTNHDFSYKAFMGSGVGLAQENSTLIMSRGKMLGGCSSINALLYSRGKPGDYDLWATFASGWNWDAVLPYFKKLENMIDDTINLNPFYAPLHSQGGPIGVSRPFNKYFNEFNKINIDSFEEIGIKSILEMNGPELEGVTVPHFIIHNHRRQSTAESYLRYKNKPNLFIATNSRAVKIIIDKNTLQANGVQVVLENDKTVNVFANKEIIVSAGAIDSPKLLMLSGIGPKEELQKFNIEILADLPVGQNMMDHSVLPFIYLGKKGLLTALQNLNSIPELDTFPTPTFGGYFNVVEMKNRTQPDIQFYATHIGGSLTPLLFIGCKAILNYDDNFCKSLAFPNLNRELNALFLVLLHPKSTGSVRLRSTNAFDDPIIELGYFRNKEDLDKLTAAVIKATKLINTSYYRKVKGILPKLEVKGCEGIEFNTYSYWRCYTRNAITTIYHPTSTCPMGPDGVLDERLRVRGIGHLRVVDASSFPTIPSGNTATPTMMLAERAADLIKQDNLLEP